MNLLLNWVRWFLARRRFPELLAITGALFLIDVVVPDFIPFIDEILLGLLTLLFASLKKSVAERMKDGGD